MLRTLIAIGFLASLPAAQAAPRLDHTITSCADHTKPSLAERKVAERLKGKPCDLACLKALVAKLPPPVRHCYHPKRPPEKWEACAKEMRRKPYVEATTSGKAGAIEVHQRLVTYCNAKGKLSLSIKQAGSTLRMIERFKAKKVARCVCPLGVRATIQGLPPGEYSLEVVFDNRYAKNREVLKRVEGLRISEPK